MERTVSFMNGEGFIEHNTRKFIASNVDESRTKDNIVLINEDIKQVYRKLFDKALVEYNAKQKRKDRKIKSYYEKISRSRQEKLFYEVIVQIGNRDDTGVGSFAADLATCVLEDYVKKFQERNPNLYVFGAYIHLDEETPHVHIDFVPWVSGYKRGLETHTSLKAALATRGFKGEGKGNTEWRQWAEAEKEDISLIMKCYGLDWLKKDTHNPHLSVLDYKKQERAKEVAALESELEDIGVVIELKEEKLETLDKEIEEKRISYRREQIKAQMQLADTVAENEKKELEGRKLSLINSQLKAEYYETVDALDDTKNELAEVESKVAKMTQAYKVAKDEFEWTQQEILEAEKLRKELLGVNDAERYLREEVIELRYQNQKLKEENCSLRNKLEKAYEFMKQFVIGGRNLLEKFMEWIGEKMQDIGRGR